MRRVAQDAHAVGLRLARGGGEGDLPAAGRRASGRARRTAPGSCRGRKGCSAPCARTLRVAASRARPSASEPMPTASANPTSDLEPGERRGGRRVDGARAPPRCGPGRARAARSARAGRRLGAGSAARLTSSKVRSARRRAGSEAARRRAGPPQLGADPVGGARRRRDGELEAGLERRGELAGEAVAAGADAAPLQIAARPVGAHGGDEPALAADVDIERGAAVGAVDRPAGDAVRAHGVDEAVDARPDLGDGGRRGRSGRFGREATWRSPFGGGLSFC